MVCRYAGIIFSVLFILGCGVNEKIELKVGLIDKGAHLYYQEYDAGLGDKMIDGYVDLSQLPNKIDGGEGYPVATLTVSLQKIYQDENDDLIYEDWDILSDMWSLAMNIETGYYAVKGLPDIPDSAHAILLKVDDVHWNPPSHERYTIWKTFSTTQWNNAVSPFRMPEVTFRIADPSITMNISFRYMVDAYWLENGTFENEEDANYAEMDYSQLSAIATMGVEDWTTGAGVTNRVNEILEYNVTTQLTMNNLQNQNVSFSGFGGGLYNQIGVFVLVNGERYHGDSQQTFMLNSGDNATRSVDVYIP